MEVSLNTDTTSAMGFNTRVVGLWIIRGTSLGNLCIQNLHIYAVFTIPYILHPSPINQVPNSPCCESLLPPISPSLPSFASTLPVMLSVLLPIQILSSFSGASGQQEPWEPYDGCEVLKQLVATGNYETLSYVAFDVIMFLFWTWSNLIGR